MPEHKSLIDCAFDVLSASKSALPFKELFDKVAKLADLPADSLRQNMSKLYTELTIDSRFTSLEGNSWDLRSRHTFAEYHVSTDDIIVDDEDDEEEDFDREEQRLQEEELGESPDESLEEESDDFDFDSKKTSSETDEEF